MVFSGPTVPQSSCSHGLDNELCDLPAGVLLLPCDEPPVPNRVGLLQPALDVVGAPGPGGVLDAPGLNHPARSLIGSYYAQYLAGTPFPQDWPETVVETVLAGLGRADV